LPVPVKIDSGSDWTMLPTRDCFSCTKQLDIFCRIEFILLAGEFKSCGDGYDPSEAFARVSKNNVQVTYGST
jgi:hypothetical protein